MALRFGLLGTGYWAAENHGPVLASHPEAALVGVWGRNPTKADQLAARYGARAYPELADLLADVDAVAVALPPDIQAGLAATAAEAGKHLLLDKPLALSTAAADRVVTAVDQRDLATLVFFTSRFHRSIETFLAALGPAERWDGARVTMLASIFQPGSPFGSSAWRKDRGGLWDVGPHALSIIVPVLGPVARVAAIDGPHATVHLLLSHESGAASTMSLTLDAPPAMAAREVVFFGDEGVVAVPSAAGSAREAFATAVGELVRAAADGSTRHRCDVRFGREVVGVLEAAEAARRHGRTVSVPPPAGASPGGIPADAGREES